MLFDNKAVLSLALAFPAALAVVLQDTSGNPYGGGHVDYHFNLANDYIQPDGYTRSAVLVNGQFHGPTIYATKGDRLNVQVNNQLTDPTMRRSTSIHWHGITQHRTNYQDGPSFVTQCPIGPNSTYTYSMDLPSAGTYWYHSHLSTQYLDGLRGVIVIYDPNDPHKSLYDVDDEGTIITLADWWHEPAPAATAKYLDSSNTAGNESVPDSGLINGAGRYVGGPEVPWSRINVVKGKRYRMRIVNTSGNARYRFAIQGHSLTVIEVDGVSHQPLTGDYIDVYAGQRYSVIVTADQPVDNYWITAPASVRTSVNNPTFDPNSVFAVLHYEGADDYDPTSTPPIANGTQLLEHNFVPIDNPGLTGSGPADQVFNLHFNITIDAEGTKGLAFTVNNVTYKSPKLPALLKVLSGASESSDFDRNENAVIIKPGSIVEINVTGFPDHPFHLHGHAFDVIQSATGPPNYINPPRRDVLATAGAKPITIRYIADNPGPWLFHCHIDMHLEAGLAALFVEDPQGTRDGPKSVVPDAAWEGLCKAYYALDPALQ